MEWKTPKDPKLDSVRERLIFAWTPKECDDGITRWLCKVRVVECWRTGRESPWDSPIQSLIPRWHVYKYYRAEVELQNENH